MARELIRLDDVHRAFGPLTVLEGINLRIDEGDRIGVVGHNGAGKTTLLRTISNQDQEFLKTDLENPLRVVMFEKDSWIWGGIPYGRRSGYTSLIITPLDEFLPESELSIFIEWMSENYNWLIAPFKKNLVDRSKQWLRDSEEKIIFRISEILDRSAIFS